MLAHCVHTKTNNNIDNNNKPWRRILFASNMHKRAFVWFSFPFSYCQLISPSLLEKVWGVLLLIADQIMLSNEQSFCWLLVGSMKYISVTMELASCHAILLGKGRWVKIKLFLKCLVWIFCCPVDICYDSSHYPLLARILSVTSK